MTDRREIDVSTGKPRSLTDAEAYAEIATQHGDSWKDRKGERVEVTVLRDGLTAFGRVYLRGERIEITVGSHDWISTVDPNTGRSWLDANLKQQQQTYGRVMFLPTAQLDRARTEHPEVEFDEPIGQPTYDDDRAYRPTPMPKSEQKMYANLRALWAEEDRLAAEPLRQRSTHEDVRQPDPQSHQAITTATTTEGEAPGH